ncbi:PAAR domain-containing protein [Aquitalea sp. ASV15]|uniref:PAAR domain-containing protein n=1 Tax=Aquitalea sp. ASV15 TaxID=2795104 RepID=UPI0018EC9B0D|nr:PAAR domain-containing protein [Aquitalea sp. ASV15]
MQRLIAVDGDKTTAGGTVHASGPGLIHGKKLACEHDPVSCPACHSTGRIVCVGERHVMFSHGKRIALQDDLCHCQCQPKPRIIVIGQGSAHG